MLNSFPQLVPLLTPYTDDTSQVSEVRLSRLIQWHRRHGADGYVVGTEAGEWHALSHSERKQIMEWVIRDAQGQPVYVQVTAMTTAASIDICQHASRHGARAALYAPPHLGLSEEEVKSVMQSLKRHGGIPVAMFEFHLGQDFTSLECHSFLDAGLSELAMNRVPVIDEAVVGGMAISPVHIFGVENAKKIYDHWPLFKLRVQALFKHGKAHRVGKEIMFQLDQDMGCPRAPLHGLDQTGKEMIKSILADIAD